MSTLYLVATPIGNLGDITYRAVETLKKVDVIACEDTRHTLVLLNHLGIKKPLMSYYKQKEQEGSEKICSLLEEGKDVALVSDAGMPCVSDPGAVISQKARERGYNVTVVPGACAVVSAVALCGIDTGFVFIGFLPDKKKEATDILDTYKNASLPLVFYSAPHDINKQIAFLGSTLGNREFFAVKEITKLHETVYRGNLEGGEIEEARGEFVLIVMPKTEKEGITDDFIRSLLTEKLKLYDKKTAISMVVDELKVPKNKVYKMSLDMCLCSLNSN